MAENGQFIEVSELEKVSGRYQVMISFREEDAPIGDMYVLMDGTKTSDEAKEALTRLSIQNGVLNILNSLAEVKGFHTYSDYITVLGLVEGIEKVREDLDRTFKFSLKSVTEEEYEKHLAERKAELEAEQSEQEAAAEAKSVDVTEEA